MNEPRDALSDEQLDLLVDGELSASQQQDLLRRLEQEPGAWRRCALAFLEAQCWKRELASLRRAPEAELPPGPAAKTPASVRPVPRLPAASPSSAGWLRRHSPTALAMAASFLVALVVGWSAWPRLRAPSPSVPAGNEIVKNDPVVPAAPRTAVSPTVIPHGAAVQTVSTQAEAPRELANSPWQMVNVSVPNGQQGNRSIRVPAIPRDRLDENWVRSMPQAMPPEVLQALERMGHRVTESRHLVPVPLEDGRRLVVPVDQVDVHYVGNKAYQ